MNGLLYAGRHLAQDLLSTLVFAAALTLTGRLDVAVACGVLLGIGQVLWSWYSVRRLPLFQVISLVMVIGFGTASLIADDPRIAMFKPSVIYAVIGVVMLKPGWMRRYVSDRVNDLLGDVLQVFGFVWAGLMLATSALNGILAYGASIEVWTGFLAFFPIVSKVVLFLGQYAVMKRVGRARKHRQELAAAAVP
ncbi:inner membrane-spanning protein YciB [Oryzibacter oryziterrae]|uniref:inner membrane-spanning protein YciB n=1 Tax=Oryzibacter oryziterrae TaxID=2766474 RepID=UPI001F2230A7|nr:septation protein IspZ [Oryzibacter oryziterrae]